MDCMWPLHDLLTRRVHPRAIQLAVTQIKDAVKKAVDGSSKNIAMVVVPQELTDDDAVMGLLQEIITGWRYADKLAADALDEPRVDKAQADADASPKVPLSSVDSLRAVVVSECRIEAGVLGLWVSDLWLWIAEQIAAAQGSVKDQEQHCVQFEGPRDRHRHRNRRAGG